MARNKYDIDETLQTEFSISHLKRLAGYIKPYRKDMAMVIFLMTISSALGMLTPRILMDILDVYIPNGDVKGIVLISLVRWLFILLYPQYFNEDIGNLRLTKHNYKISDIFEHLQEPYFHIRMMPHGDSGAGCQLC